MLRKVNNYGDKQHLQYNDPDKLVELSEKCQMLFNFGNLNVNYNMGDTVLSTTVREKDLGIKNKC